MVAPDSAQDMDRFDSSLGMRVVWWNAGFELVQQQPLGSGSGSTRRRLMQFSMEAPPQLGEALSSSATFNPHSPWVATAIQQGVPGVALLLVVGVAGGVSGWRRGRSDPLLLSLGPIWLVVAGFSVMHGVLIESYTAMLVSVLLVGSVGCLARAQNDNTPDHPVEGAEGSCSN